MENSRQHRALRGGPIAFLSALCFIACGASGHSTANGGAAGADTAGTGGTAGVSNSGAAGRAGSAGSVVNGGAGIATGGAAGAAATAGASGGSANSAGSGGTGPTTSGNNYDGERATTVSFDSTWKFHLGDVTAAQGTAFDDTAWAALDVPHDWSISLPFNQTSAAHEGGGYLDGGVGWYRKTFSLPASSSEQLLVAQFDGVYMDSTVWLNEKQVCARPYGYSSFECDLTKAAKPGSSNVIALRVNNQLPSSRWYSGSGIYRHVWLKTVNPVHVAYMGTQLTTPQVSAASATLNISVAVQNSAGSDQSVTVQSSIRNAAGAEVATAASAAQPITAGQTADVPQTVTLTNPALWSPSSPKLYSLVTTVSVAGAVVDTYTTPFGIRSFAFDANTGFAPNGVKMKLNGVCLHHDLGSLGAAVNYRAIEKRLQLLKEMGVNAIRTSHNPPDPELLEFADRLGFLVMDEAFDTWYNGKNPYDYGRFFRQWASTGPI